MKPIDGLNVATESWPDFDQKLIALGSKAQKGVLFENNDDLGYIAGIWEAEPNITSWLTYPCDELMILLQGSVCIIEEGGKTTTFHAGDAFFISRGLRCVWAQTTRVKKYFTAWTKGPVQKTPELIALDPKDQKVSFAIYRTVALWKSADTRYQVGVRKVKKGEKSLATRDELLFVVDGGEQTDNKTFYIKAGSNVVFPEEFIAIFSSFDVTKNAAKL